VVDGVTWDAAVDGTEANESSVGADGRFDV
jgi:hypothetical protein